MKPLRLMMVMLGVMMVGVLPGLGEAVTLLDNSSDLGTASSDLSTVEVAQQFTTGNDTYGYNLDSVDLYVGGLTNFQDLTVRVLADGGSSTPGIGLTTLVYSSSGSGTVKYSFSPALRVEASTSYWWFIQYDPSGSESPTLGLNNAGEEANTLGWNLPGVAQTRAVGSSSAWSGASYRVRLIVEGDIAANSPPSGASGTITVVEDTRHVFATHEFGFSDSDGENLDHVSITALPSEDGGTLWWRGTAITAGSLPHMVTGTEINSGRFSYTPPSNTWGDGLGSFRFKVSDGTDYSDEYDMVVNVAAANRAPSVLGQTAVIYGEHSTDAVATYVGVDAQGQSVTWEVSGVDGDAFSIDDSGELRFASSPDYHSPTDADGDNEYLVTVVGSDGELTTELEVRVTVNGAPVWSGETQLSYDENGSGEMGPFTVRDPEGDAIGYEILSTADGGLFGSRRDGDGIFLSWETWPDFEEPGDTDADNTYEVTLVAYNPAVAGSRVERMVTITVTDGDDLPVAVDDVVETAAGEEVVIQVLENDRDPDDGVLAVVGVGEAVAPRHGTAELMPYSTTAIRYTPAAAFVGTDTFSYTMSDGFSTAAAIVTVVVGDKTNPVVEIAAETTDAVRGLLTVTIVFSEAVKDFDEEDVQVWNGSVVEFDEVSPTEYRLEIAAERLGQVVGIVVAPGVAEDDAGNGNLGAELGVETGIGVSYGAASYTAPEAGEAATLTVQLSQEWSTELAIPIRVTRPETTEASDYAITGLADWDETAGGGALIFAAGVTEAVFRVAANLDRDGDDETLELGFGPFPEAVGVGERATATVLLEDHRTGEDVGPGRSLEGMLGVMARSMGVSALSAIESRFDRYRQWRNESLGRRRARWQASSDGWWRGVSLGWLGSLEGYGPAAALLAGGSDGPESGGRYRLDGHDGYRLGAASLGLEGGELTARPGGEFPLSEIAYERRLALSEGPRGWTPVVWGQVDRQEFQGDLGSEGPAYQGSLTSVHLGLELYAGPAILGGLVFVHSRGGLDYADEGVEGQVDSGMNTFHPYVYWQPGERFSVWGFLGLGSGDVDVSGPGMEGGGDAEFRMVAGGVRGVVSHWGSTDWSLKADMFRGELSSSALEGLGEASGSASRLRLLLEWELGWWLAEGLLNVQLEAGGRFEGGDAEGGSGVETGFRVGYVNAETGLDVAVRGRMLAAGGNGYRDWGFGVQGSWDPGAGDRGFRASVASVWGRDGGGAAALWAHGEMVTRRSRPEALGLEADLSMVSEVAYGGLQVRGLPGVLTPYSRLRWNGQGDEVALGAAWQPGEASPRTGGTRVELEGVRRDYLDLADAGVWLRLLMPF